MVKTVNKCHLIKFNRENLVNMGRLTLIAFNELFINFTDKTKIFIICKITRSF